MSAPITLPPLPYADNALDPVISANTLELPLRQAPQGLRGQPQQADRRHAAGRPAAGAHHPRGPPARPTRRGVFNNAAQIWNHTFYWNSLKPNGGGTPTGRAGEADRARLRQPRQPEEGTGHRGDHAVRQRLGVAGFRRRQAGGDQDQQCRAADDQGPEGAADHRRVGTRRHYLDYQNRRPGLRQRGDRQAAELAVRAPTTSACCAAARPRRIQRRVRRARDLLVRPSDQSSGAGAPSFQPSARAFSSARTKLSCMSLQIWQNRSAVRSAS